MTPEERDALLAKPLNAIVGINRREGGPQLTPVWFYWDGEQFSFSTTRDRAKYRLIRRDPNITLIVDDLEAHQYVVAYGRAQIVENDLAQLARPISEKYAKGNAEQMVAALAQDPSRVIVLLRPQKLVTR